VVIQLGAVLALTSVYAVMLGHLFAAARTEDAARRAIVSVLLAFLPAVGVGFLAHDFIKTVLFETPMLIAVMLILGGVVLLVIDRLAPPPESPMRWTSALWQGAGDRLLSSALPWCPACRGRGDDRGRAADGCGKARGGRVFLPAVAADHGRGGGL
jgi:hypothetical protein